MKFIHQLCILLLINFAACSSEQEDPCNDENIKYRECNQNFQAVQSLLDDLNATDGDTDMLRSEINRYCESGFKYIQCIEGITFTAQCLEADFKPAKNQVFPDKIIKFALEYFCRNEGEALLKIVANDGLKSILKLETDEAIERCLPSTELSDYNNTPTSELFCRNVDASAGCYLESSDKMTNQEISAIIRDIIPQMKVIGNCAPTA